jgi:hypothetical protein
MSDARSVVVDGIAYRRVPGATGRRLGAFLAAIILAFLVIWLQENAYFIALKYAAYACGLLMGYASFHWDCALGTRAQTDTPHNPIARQK